MPFAARASFNLGWMYQFGVGVPPDPSQARRYYRRCFEVHPGGVQAPVQAMLALLSLQAYLMDMPSMQEYQDAYAADLRTHVLVLHIVMLFVLLGARLKFQARRSARREAPSG